MAGGCQPSPPGAGPSPWVKLMKTSQGLRFALDPNLTRRRDRARPLGTPRYGYAWGPPRAARVGHGASLIPSAWAPRLEWNEAKQSSGDIPRWSPAGERLLLPPLRDPERGVQAVWASRRVQRQGSAVVVPSIRKWGPTWDHFHPAGAIGPQGQGRSQLGEGRSCEGSARRVERVDRYSPWVEAAPASRECRGLEPVVADLWSLRPSARSRCGTVQPGPSGPRRPQLSVSWGPTLANDLNPTLTAGGAVASAARGADRGTGPSPAHGCAAEPGILAERCHHTVAGDGEAADVD